MDYIPDATSGPGFMFGFSSNSLTIKEEALLYPFDSFLAEFGGSLGLFLGFSFRLGLDLFLGQLFLPEEKFEIIKKIFSKKPKQYSRDFVFLFWLVVFVIA